MHVLAHGRRLVLARGPREREDLVEDPDGGLGIGDREDRALGVGAREAGQLFRPRVDRVLQRDEAVGRKALDEALVEDAELQADVLDQRVLRVELAEGVDLLGAQQRRGLSALTGDDEIDVGIRVQTGGGGECARDDDAGRRHVGDADRLALEVAELLDRAVGRDGDRVARRLVGRVEILDLHPLEPADGQRLHARQRHQEFARGHEFDAVGRPGERDHLDVQPFLGEPTHLGGHRELRADAGGERARAGADPDARLGLGGRGGDEEDEGDERGAGDATGEWVHGSSLYGR